MPSPRRCDGITSMATVEFDTVNKPKANPWSARVMANSSIVVAAIYPPNNTKKKE